MTTKQYIIIYILFHNILFHKKLFHNILFHKKLFYYYNYVEGRTDKQRRIEPKLATSYLTTRGKSFSK